MNITLPINKQQNRDFCKQCGDKLTKESRYRRQGITNLRCKHCLSKNVAKYNAKRKERLKNNKLW